MAGFKPKLKNNQIAEEYGRRARAVAFEAYRRILKRTPVKTGVTKANWHVSVGQPSEWLTKSTTGQGFPKIDPEQVMRFKTIHIQNNVAWIGLLEYGYSKKSPAGMVRITAVELSSGVNIAVNGNYGATP